MPSEKKIQLKESYTKILNDNPEFVLTRYIGLNVQEISGLRRSLTEKGVQYKVVKNNIFKQVIKENSNLTDFPAEEIFTGPIGVAFTSSDMPSVAKILKDFSKENENFSVMAGVMESKFYDENGINTIANLPSRDQSLATLASALNSPATKIAGMMGQIMGSLARAIKAVGEKNG